MRIVHVVRQFYPAVGGFESVVRELGSEQVALGHTVKVVTLNRLFKSKNSDSLAHRDMIDGMEIVRVPYFGSTRYPIAFSVLRHIRDADIVHVHAIDFFFDFLAWTKPLHGKKLVVSTHGGFFHTSFATRLKRIYFATATRWSMVWYDGVAAVSLPDQAEFSKIRRRGLVCIENGVNTSKFSNASSEVPTKSLIWIGRFSQNKRLDRLILFFAALLKQDPAWRLTIAGQPWDVTLAELKAMAIAAGVEESLVIVNSPADAEIETLMRNCSVIVSCSDYEGFGIAAVEGMSAGLLPLLSNISPFKRLVANSGVGLNIEFEHPDAAGRFLAKWHDLVSNQESDESYASVRQRAIVAASRYNWSNVAELYDSFYNKALGNAYRTILDVPIFVGTEVDAVREIDSRYQMRSSTMIAFANANALNVAAVDDGYRSCLKQCFVMNDGIGVDTASRILFGANFPQNLNGTDFTPNYLQTTKNRYRIFLLGAAPGIAEKAAARLLAMCPRHQIVGCRDGYFSASENAAVVASIRESRADVVVVAMGNPSQELWLADNLRATGCRLGFGVGALFDFLAGEAFRAPVWVRKVHMEWFYRLLREPGRLWRRYLLGNPVFLARVLTQWLSGARV